MKKLITLSIVFATSLAFGHSMSPQYFGGAQNPVQGMTTTGFVIVPIKVSTGNPATIEISIDGKRQYAFDLAKYGRKQIEVPVTLDKPNQVETHEVCSVSKQGISSTKLCTTVKAYWIHKNEN